MNSRGMPGYGHLGVFPAQIIVESFSNIEVRENPLPPYRAGAGGSTMKWRCFIERRSGGVRHFTAFQIRLQ